MIWAKIRFTVSTTGHYAEAQLGFPTEDIPTGALMASIHCSGYRVGCGLVATIDQVAGHANSALPHYIMPEAADLLFKYIERMKTL